LEKRQGLLKLTLDVYDMENSGSLSNKILSITCPCGIVFETYDPKKMYHSNSCRVNCDKKRHAAKILQRRRQKQKKLKEQSYL
jgi:hypothetical protein